VKFFISILLFNRGGAFAANTRGFVHTLGREKRGEHAKVKKTKRCSPTQKTIADSMPPCDVRQRETICTSLLTRGRLRTLLCLELASWRYIAIELTELKKANKRRSL
jgi:hypothetical protein